jgi:hypothetical protein
MSTEEFIETLVSRLNVELDVPFIGEEAEASILRWCVTQASPFIPSKLRGAVLSAADGIDEQELATIEEIVVDLINENIDIPWLPESQEASLVFRPIVKALSGYAKLGNFIAV